MRVNLMMSTKPNSLGKVTIVANKIHHPLDKKVVVRILNAKAPLSGGWSSKEGVRAFDGGAPGPSGAHF